MSYASEKMDEIQAKIYELQTEYGTHFREYFGEAVSEFFKPYLDTIKATNEGAIPVLISVDTYPESDDEGGSSPYINSFYIRDEKGDTIDLEIEVTCDFGWKEGTYTATIYDEFRDWLSDTFSGRDIEENIEGDSIELSYE